MSALRIGAFNVENLFDRPKAMGAAVDDASTILDAHSRLNVLLQEPEYTEAIRRGILEQLEVLGLLNSDVAEFALLRQNRGRLLKRSPANGVSVVAEGRGSWIGWVELTRERVDELAMTHTAQVIRDVNADILGVVEADNRIALKRFPQCSSTTSRARATGRRARTTRRGCARRPGWPRSFGRCGRAANATSWCSGTSTTPPTPCRSRRSSTGRGCATSRRIPRSRATGGTNGTLFPHYPTMTDAVHAASDHAAIYADLDLA